jgi:RND family efflux transporter MFP subunit
MEGDETPHNEVSSREAQAPTPSAQKPRRARRWLVVVVALLIVAIAFVFGALPRINARKVVDAETAQLAVMYVSVIHPERAPMTRQIVVPGDVQAYASAPIFARTNGYLKRWYVDIGARVKKGQILALISAPEVDQQLQQARGSQAAAEANLRLSEATARRFTELRSTNAVSQQEVDNAVGAFQANQATLQAVHANVRQLEQLQSYEQVRAPFDGVISVRNTDVGDLINAGNSSTPNTELFHVVQADKLRVYVNLPETFSQTAKPGLTAQLTLGSFPGHTVTGKLVRTANAIEPSTRTLRAEIEVDNPTGALFAGAYAEVRLELPAARQVFSLPVEALLFRKDGLHVATVSNGQVVMRRITAGHDFGDHIEVVQGLVGDESVVMNPPDSITTGDHVKIAAPSAPPKAQP